MNRFNNYISLESTGGSRSGLPEYAYVPVRARFTGLESSASVRLLDAASTVDLELRADLVRAVNLDTGEALPRIATARTGDTLLWAQGPWSARLGASHSAAQNSVPSGQLSTGAYTVWTAAAAHRMKAGAAELLWFARVDNLSDTLAYSASSILTQTAAGKAPLPGRSVKLGVQMSF